jgi:hypothetical protein
VRWLVLLTLAGALLGLGAAGGFANTVPGIEGDGNQEDSPVLTPGVPILHVHVNPHWRGWVRSTTPIDYRIDCPMACRRSFQAGTSVTLQAHPQAGWSVSGWSIPGADVQCQAQSQDVCSFTMPGPTTGLPQTGELEVVVNLAKTASSSP